MKARKGTELSIRAIGQEGGATLGGVKQQWQRQEERENKLMQSELVHTEDCKGHDQNN